MGPIARVGDGVSGSRGGGRPGRPEEERGKVSEPLRIADGPAWDRVLSVTLAEHLGEVLVVRLEGARADGIDGQRFRGRVVVVGPQGQAQPLAQRRLRLWPQSLIWASVLGPRPVVEDQLAFAMEPVGRPVRRHVAAVTPDRSHFHAAQGLPDRLPATNAPLGDDHLAVARDDSRGNGRHVLVDAAAYPAQDREAEDHDDCQKDPESLHARLLSPHPLAPSMRLSHSGNSESRHSLITKDFTSPSRRNGSSLEKASASSRVLKMAMLPPSVNGPMPRTTPLAMNLSTTALWRGYTAMIASLLAPDDSPMTTAFMRLLLLNARATPVFPWSDRWMGTSRNVRHDFVERERAPSVFAYAPQRASSFEQGTSLPLIEHVAQFHLMRRQCKRVKS